jgi:RHH-type proline utilization regulon transcriptional repressor/proline dehydrogenase/delta 1-pyrroline-5-carboxylate dehydrogenase
MPSIQPAAQPLQPSAITPPLSASPLRAAITAATRLPEPELLPGLLNRARMTEAQAQQTQALALRLSRSVRDRALDSGRAGLVQGLLQEFALSSQEGVALMCLAEALLRIPDAATRDALIRDKIGHGNWQQHLGKSPSLFVNAATWGLLLTGRLVATHSDSGLSAVLRRIVSRGGEPMVRKGVDMAMRMMGEQFVTGQHIDEALRNAAAREPQGFRYSYDMLGEAALTAHDAARFLQAYEQAIHAIGRAAAGRGIHEGPGISIKLSALHPRYSRAQVARVMTELLPRLAGLARLARRYDIGLNIDAEESDRLELSLELLEALCADPTLAGWNGIGFVIQAYSKRCPAVVDFLVDLARRSQRRLMVRLVKGAYWDSEIKRAQLDGLPGYPVYTRKAYTDVAYIACARALLAAPDAVYPQFATHNAHTMAAIHTLAGADYHAGQYEFQCLHGMGEPLYEQVVGAVDDGKLGRPCRIYAPVGSHDTLLAYLVRRLLENGANSSFVNRIADATLPLEQLVQDPVQTVQAMAAAEGVCGAPHAAIALPGALYGGARANSAGMDLASEPQLAALSLALGDAAATPWQAGPATCAPTNGSGPGLQTGLQTGLRPGLQTDLQMDLQTGLPMDLEPDPQTGLQPGMPRGMQAGAQPVRNPADPSDTVGWVQEATADDVQAALAAAQASAPAWAAESPLQRAAMLQAAAQLLQDDADRLCTLLVREAGKTFANAAAEVREAVDFLRYYAAQVRCSFDNSSHRPLGPVVCISPWNFPLAIFVGQLAAALAAGNVVLAKPAEQTPLVAAAAVRALHAAGVPAGALQLLPGRGETVGAALVADARVQAVLFTGSIEVARILQRSLATRLTAGGQPVPLVAETGGQNAMVVDSSALTEQVVQDAVNSAFDSAGQRCSALRVLCVQRDAADRLVQMLQGAMAELHVGDPRRLAVDVGPVIDAEAQAGLERHIQTLRERGHRVWQALPAGAGPADAAAAGTRPAGAESLPGANTAGAGVADTSAADTSAEGASAADASAADASAAEVSTAARRGSAAGCPRGCFVPPTLIEIDSLAELEREVFGPVLHLLRYDRDDLGALLQAINATGYGLTCGVHSRIDETVAQVAQTVHAGNLYVNRNVVGAVVGVQPFGGEGLSGTGPKAGGPLYLLRLLAHAPADAARAAVTAAGSPASAPLRGFAPDHGGADSSAALQALQDWARAQGLADVAQACEDLAALSPTGAWRALPGPTGEANLYAVQPRAAVLCLAPEAAAGDGARLLQLAAVLAVGSRAVWPAQARGLWERLHADVRERITLAQDWRAPAVPFDAVLRSGTADELKGVLGTLSRRAGPIVGVSAVQGVPNGAVLARLVSERSISVNTAAAGGNASLMTIG